MNRATTSASFLAGITTATSARLKDDTLGPTALFATFQNFPRASSKYAQTRTVRKPAIIKGKECIPACDFVSKCDQSSRAPTKLLVREEGVMEDGPVLLLDARGVISTLWTPKWGGTAKTYRRISIGLQGIG